MELYVFLAFWCEFVIISSVELELKKNKLLEIRHFLLNQTKILWIRNLDSYYSFVIHGQKSESFLVLFLIYSEFLTFLLHFQMDE